MAKGHDRQKEKHWRKVLAEQSRSGLTVRVFCRERKLPEPRFYWWKRALASRKAAARPRRRTAKRFVPVQVTPDPAGACTVSVALGDGRRVCIQSSVGSLVGVLAALEGIASC